MWAPTSLKPNRSRFYVVFLGPGANSELVANIHVALHASYAPLHKFNLRIFAKTQPFHSCQNFVITLASKLSPNAQLLPSAAYSQQSTFPSRYRLHFTLFQAYLCHKDAKGLRENLQSSKLSLFPPIITNAVPRPASLLYLPVSSVWMFKGLLFGYSPGQATAADCRKARCESARMLFMILYDCGGGNGPSEFRIGLFRPPRLQQA